MTTRASMIATAPVSLVIDHIQVNFGLGTVSIHCLRVNADDSRSSGFDHDAVTRAELNIPDGADLLTELTPDRILAFVSAVDGVPVSFDAPAPSVDAIAVDPAPTPAPAPVATIGTATPTP